MSDDRGQVTELLGRWAAGDPTARERLVPIVYGELRALAGRFMRRERKDHTLQPTALVHEAILRFYDRDQPPSRGKAELMGLVAQTMRHILVDHARRKQAERRGGGRTLVEFSEELGDGARGTVEVLELDLALSKLARLDERQANAVELRVFGGYEVSEVAEILDISPATVKRDWSSAKLWLYRELRGSPPA